MEELLVFAGSSSGELAGEICEKLGIAAGRLEVSRFSNGNLLVRILENVRERDVFVIQSFAEPVSDNIMELFITMDALRSASARRITAVIPYYSYARSDKKDAPRISIAGRLMADLIKTAGADRVLTVDLHADSVHGFFSVPVDHLTAMPLIAEAMGREIDPASAVAVATDAGGAKRVGKFAKFLDIPMAIIDKRRDSDTKVRQGFVVGDVTGRDALIFDDEIATGGTLSATTETLARAGVRKMYMGVTHPVLCGNAVENIVASGLTRLFVGNTVRMGPEKRLGMVSVVSVAPLLAEAIRRIHTGESVGALFK